MAQRSASRTSRNGSGSALEPPPGPPDVLGNQGRIEIVANMLGMVQRQAFQLRTEVAANGLDDESVVGLKPGTEKPETAAEKRARLEAAEERVQTEFSDLMPQVQQVLDKR